jgi:hypothetical protein
VVFRQAVLSTELSFAETAVTEHSLGGVLALLGLAPNLLGRHRDVKCGLGSLGRVCVDGGTQRSWLVCNECVCLSGGRWGSCWLFGVDEMQGSW